MFSVQLYSRRLCTCLSRRHSLPDGPFSSSVFSLSSLAHVQIESSDALQENPVLLNYLLNTLQLPQNKVLKVFNRYSGVKARTIEKPKLVVHFLKSNGFTDAQIQSTVCTAPQILFADVEKTLKPKFQLFEELGITGSNLCKLVSIKAILLTRSVEKTMKPSIEVLNKVLITGTDDHNWFRILQRCEWVVAKHPALRLVPNISYLKSIGIVGAQLSSLLKKQPHLFALLESDLKKLVSEVLDAGFSTDSKMLVHGLHTLACISRETFSRKVQLLQSYDFSKSECMEMFRRAPALFRTSEEKIRLGLEFYLEKVKLEKSTLVQRPTILMFSMEERVFPRYQVFLLIKSKKLLKKDPSFLYVLYLPEHQFLEKFISRFTENVCELLMAYKGHLLDSGENSK